MGLFDNKYTGLTGAIADYAGSDYQPTSIDDTTNNSVSGFSTNQRNNRIGYANALGNIGRSTQLPVGNFSPQNQQMQQLQMVKPVNYSGLANIGMQNNSNLYDYLMGA